VRLSDARILGEWSATLKLSLATQEDSTDGLPVIRPESPATAIELRTINALTFKLSRGSRSE
jgi:hypothetical protein